MSNKLAAEIKNYDKAEHMRSNAQLDFVISDEDMNVLRNMEQKDYGKYSAFPVYSGK